MNQEAKEKFLKSQDWFFMNNKWHHPQLTQPMDLQSAWLYDEEDEKLFDSEVGF